MKKYFSLLFLIAASTPMCLQASNFFSFAEKEDEAQNDELATMFPGTELPPLAQVAPRASSCPEAFTGRIGRSRSSSVRGERFAPEIDSTGHVTQQDPSFNLEDAINQLETLKAILKSQVDFNYRPSHHPESPKIPILDFASEELDDAEPRPRKTQLETIFAENFIPEIRQCSSTQKPALDAATAKLLQLIKARNKTFVQELQKFFDKNKQHLNQEYFNHLKSNLAHPKSSLEDTTKNLEQLHRELITRPNAAAIKTKSALPPAPRVFTPERATSAPTPFLFKSDTEPKLKSALKSTTETPSSSRESRNVNFQPNPVDEEIILHTRLEDLLAVHDTVDSVHPLYPEYKAHKNAQADQKQKDFSAAIEARLNALASTEDDDSYTLPLKNYTALGYSSSSPQ